MKKYLIVFGFSFFLLGCSLIPEKADDTLPKPIIQVDNIKADNFYFNAGESGITLLNTDDDDFSIQLSEQEIGEANIVDGILTFTELLDEGENVQAINLKAYAESLGN